MAIAKAPTATTIGPISAVRAPTITRETDVAAEQVGAGDEIGRGRRVADGEPLGEGRIRRDSSPNTAQTATTATMKPARTTSADRRVRLRAAR